MSPELSRLAELLRGPAALERSWDWEVVEAELRTALPTDYRELVEAYGGGLLDEYLLLLEPGCPHDVYDLVKISAEREEANDSLWQFEDEYGGNGIRGQPPGLLGDHGQRRVPVLARPVGRRPRLSAYLDQQRVGRGLGALRHDRDPVPHRSAHR